MPNFFKSQLKRTCPIWLILIIFLMNGCTPYRYHIVEADNLNPSQDYYILSDKVENSYKIITLNDLNLRFIYYEEYNNTILKYKIYNLQRDVVIDNSTQAKTIKFGKNKVIIDLSNIQPAPIGLYVLEITNDKGVKKFMKFQIAI